MFEGKEVADLSVILKPAWGNVISDNGDIDVVPLIEEHETGTGKCYCHPSVEVIGANLLIIHNSVDKREFIEQAIAIMNGEE